MILQRATCATEGESVGKLTQWGWASQRQLCVMDSPVAALAMEVMPESSHPGSQDLVNS